MNIDLDKCEKFCDLIFDTNGEDIPVLFEKIKKDSVGAVVAHILHDHGMTFSDGFFLGLAIAAASSQSEFLEIIANAENKDMYKQQKLFEKIYVRED